MNATPPATCLLDKGVIRRLYEYRRRFQQGCPLTWEQWQSVRAFVRLQQAGVTLYMARPTWNVLQTRPAALTDPPPSGRAGS